VIEEEQPKPPAISSDLVKLAALNKPDEFVPLGMLQPNGVAILTDCHALVGNRNGISRIIAVGVQVRAASTPSTSWSYFLVGWPTCTKKGVGPPAKRPISSRFQNAGTSWKSKRNVSVPVARTANLNRV
jgi:hypothetical protein